MTPYRRGADFERRIKERLEHEGYKVVRSAGSHTPCDLIAGRKGQWLAVQAKGGAKKETSAERLALIDWAEEAGATPVLVYRGMKFFWPLQDVEKDTERCPSCGGDAGDNWFDRSICACGEMHTCCSNCGPDKCPYEDDAQEAA